MTYEEAEETAYKSKWKISYCISGEKCWCRLIEPETPIIYNEDQTYILVSDGAVDERLAEYIVKLHNDNL